MTARIFLAGILAGIAMFIWNFVGHDLLPLGEYGISTVPNEDALGEALKTNLPAPGFYMFPWAKAGATATRQERGDAMNKAMEKAKNGPSGLLLYHNQRTFSFGKLLGTEFTTELIETILVVLLLAQTRIVTFIGRVGFVLVAGIVAAMATNVPYWNWYGYPTDYTIGYMTIQIVGFLCAGIVAALVMGRGRPV